MQTPVRNFVMKKIMSKLCLEFSDAYTRKDQFSFQAHDNDMTDGEKENVTIVFGILHVNVSQKSHQANEEKKLHECMSRSRESLMIRVA